MYEDDREFDVRDIFIAMIIAGCCFFAGMAVGGSGCHRLGEDESIEDVIPAEEPIRPRKLRKLRRQQIEVDNDEILLTRGQQ